MKIYINQFNLDNLEKIVSTFEPYLLKTERYTELYTNENIYKIQNNVIYSLKQHDKPIQIYNDYYDMFSLIVDTSYYNIEKEYNVQGKRHVSFQIIKNYYNIHKPKQTTKSTNSTASNLIYLVIENKKKGDTNLPFNIYFETNECLDINEPFVKLNLIEFLFHLM
jgi:hypothetical protein